MGEKDEVFIDVGKATHSDGKYSSGLPSVDLCYNGNGNLTFNAGVGIKSSSGTLTLGEYADSPQTFVVGGSLQRWVAAV